MVNPSVPCFNQDSARLFANCLVIFLSSVPYSSFFGGVTAFSPEHYLKINGFPNTYWDRNGEDDDIAERYT